MFDESSHVARFKFPVVDTNALPHVVHLLKMILESASRGQTSGNTEQLSEVVTRLKTIFKYV